MNTKARPLVYFFLLRPDGPFYKDAMALKKHADCFLDNNDSSWRLPHITLHQFLLSPTYQQKLVSVATEVVQNLKAPEFFASGVKKYPSSGTVYLSIDDQKMGLDLRDNLRKQLILNLLICNKRSEVVPRDLHITISKGVP